MSNDAENITVGDIVFYNNPHEAWMTNLITDVVEDRGETVIVRTRGCNAEIQKKELTRIPVDKAFPIYSVTTYKPRYNSPD